MGIVTLNQYLQPVGSPIDQESYTPQVPWEFGVQQHIQAKKVLMSNQQTKKIDQITTTNGASGTVTSGGTISLSSSINFSHQHGSESVYAIPHGGIYIGTAASVIGQLWPALGSANGTQFQIFAGLDYQRYNSANGTRSVWSATLINNSGTVQTIFFNVTWQYLWFNNGTA